MRSMGYLAGVVLGCACLGAQADWYIVYSPVLAKYSGRSTYCCFPTKAACEQARAQYLKPGDSVGCQGFDSPSAKKKQGAAGKSAGDQRAKQDAAQKARAAQQRQEEEAQFRRDQQETLGALKGVDDSGGVGLKSAPPAGSALNELKNDEAWSRSATHGKSDEQARDEAERGAQAQGGIKHNPVPSVPDVPPPTRVQGAGQ